MHRWIWLVSIGIMTGSALAETESPTKIRSLSAAVNVSFDQHGIPHIFAETWPDAYRVLGWIHAKDRLVQMEFNRRVATGTLAELVGADGIEPDKLARRLGIRSSSEEVWNSPAIPETMKKEMLAYAEGVNEGYESVRQTGMPAIAKLLGMDPKPWHPVDSLAFNKYMGWDQGGTSDDLWFGRMVAKFGKVATDELWPMRRPYEIPIVKTSVRRQDLSQVHPAEPASLVDVDLLAGVSPSLIDAARHSIDQARFWPRSHSFGSNNWAIDGTKTTSGKPMLCNDPHLGFRLPSIFYACHLSVAGENVAGVSFPGGPIVVIGQTDHIAWGITNMQADAVDYFIETIDPANPRRYKHAGQWKEMEVLTEKIPVKDADPIDYVIEKTIHGPIIAREGQAISMQWTGFGPSTEAVGLWKLNHAKNVQDYLTALDLVTVPCLNLIYADKGGTIAIHPMGRLPRRAPGAGRVPMDGSTGEFDWKENIPREELPLAINPKEHFVASANARPQPLDDTQYLGWMWDDSYRTRRIHDLLTKAQNIDVAAMKKIQTDAFDLAGSIYIPIFLEAMKSSPVSDPFQTELLKHLKEWDFVADPDSMGTMIWLRWFEKYRSSVWEDDFADLPKETGSWGFNGNNKREPMLEVLEQLTREKPNSPWFDDKRTQNKENRDDIIRRSFQLAAQELSERVAGSTEKLAWRNFNILQIPSITGLPAFSRKGGPVVGDEFTVNPGGGGGPVGAGASWRMIVDFNDLAKSVGIYPGGQSGDPRSKLYSDLMPIWAKGEYFPMNMVDSMEKLPTEAKNRRASFTP
ncbi:penicillin acylase family protein [bacterium]|nr:penicillin acylase family protein [bacterium]